MEIGKYAYSYCFPFCSTHQNGPKDHRKCLNRIYFSWQGINDLMHCSNKRHADLSLCECFCSYVFPILLSVCFHLSIDASKACNEGTSSMKTYWSDTFSPSVFMLLSTICLHLNVHLYVGWEVRAKHRLVQSSQLCYKSIVLAVTLPLHLKIEKSATNNCCVE